LVIVVCATGCLAGDHVAGPQDREAARWPGNVSDPVPASAAATTSASSSPFAQLAAEVVFVSLPPGTLSGDGVASIRNLQTAATVAAPMTAGGFDPVAIAAQAGDTLAIEVAIAGTERVLRFAYVVPLAARPIVVRTNPPPRKRDVPLNSQMLIVFSEPINVSTVSDASIRLLKDSQPVPGSFALPDINHLTAAFTPSAPLESGSAYSLVIGEGVTDLDGDSLSAPVVVDFTTEATAATELRFSVQPSATGVGLRMTPGVRVVATDEAGNAVASFAGVVSVAIAAGPAGAVLSGTTSVQAVNGVATFGDLSFDQSGGGFVLTARSGALSDGSSAEFTIFSPSSAASSIVFNRYRDGLFVMNTDGSGITRLTNGAGSADLGPAWSPDGRRIAFARFTTDGPSSGTYDIYTMTADGSGVTRLTDVLPVSSSGSPYQGDDVGAQWSPDGSKIAFWGGSTDAGTGDLFVANADGTGVRRIVEVDYFGVSVPQSDRVAWSPDGARIAFPDGFGAIDVVNADGSGAARLTSGYDGYDSSPAWSPDGTKIAVQRYTSCTATGGAQPCDIPTLYVMLADGSGATRLTEYAAYWPTWSPDGSKLAFHGRRPGDGDGWDIYSVNADGSNVTRLTFTPGWGADAEYQPAWSPALTSLTKLRAPRKAP
jgi:TolB protein